MRFHGCGLRKMTSYGWLGSSMSSLLHENNGVLDTPTIEDDEGLVEVVRKLSRYVRVFNSCLAVKYPS